MKEISKATIDRLSLYFRVLRTAHEEGQEVISSEELGRRIEITPEQIRKDLASFGQFGKKGVGYYVSELQQNISNILGLNRHWKIAIVGVGHLGAALANYHNFINLGFKLTALFDNNPAVIGKTVNNVQVLDIQKLEDATEALNVDIGIIAVPRREAQKVADSLVAAKVKGIWNFAPVRLRIPSTVKLVNEDLSVGLSSLSYHITQNVDF